METLSDPVISGRCYCGAITFCGARLPDVVTYCHCEDCRRATGAPVAAFAAFAEGALSFEQGEGKSVMASPGATRSFCPDCGSLITGRYDYLPGQVYISLGLIDQAAALPPTLHTHDGSRLPWLHIEDDLERSGGSGRAELSARSGAHGD